MSSLVLFGVPVLLVLVAVRELAGSENASASVPVVADAAAPKGRDVPGHDEASYMCRRIGPGEGTSGWSPLMPGTVGVGPDELPSSSVAAARQCARVVVA